MDENARGKLEVLINMQIKQVLDKIEEEGPSEEEGVGSPEKNNSASQQ